MVSKKCDTNPTLNGYFIFTNVILLGFKTCNEYKMVSLSELRSQSQLIIKYIWTNQLSTNNKGCVLLGTKTSNDNSQSNNTTTTTLNVCIPCLPTILFV